MKTFITAAFVLLFCAAFAQEKKADRLFEKWEYAEAAKLYEEAAKNDSSPDLYYKLGQCYQKMFLFEAAAVAYDRVNAAGPYDRADFYYNYGLVLKTVERYPEAREAFRKYDTMSPFDRRGKYYMASCDTVILDLQKPVPVTVSNISSINNADAAFNPVFYDEGIVYTSNSSSATGKKTFAWTGKSYLDLMYAKRGNSDTTFESAGVFNASEINDKYHDGPASFTKNGDTIYFNRVGRELKGYKKRTIGVEHSKIYYSVKKDGKWGKEQPFKYNSENYGVFTPFVTNDGSRIYFASDMPGGMGETDIYYCQKDGDDWGVPVNLGANVNTFGREQFPSLDAEGNLYFASDGYLGYGGLDICVARLQNGSFEKAEVLKAPLNSAGNEYGIAFIKSQQSGYLSSARSGGMGDADIYYFNLERDSIPCEISTAIYVIGYECNPKKKEPVAEIRVDSVVTAEVTNNMLIGSIYFDFDKSDIRTDAVNNLDSIIRVMRAHPDWNLQVSGHADCRGSSEYNVALSQRRAASAVRYLSARGIDAGRLIQKGYGEAQPVNKCTDGVPCTEPEHQKNRRVEFRITLQKKTVSMR